MEEDSQHHAPAPTWCAQPNVRAHALYTRGGGEGKVEGNGGRHHWAPHAQSGRRFAIIQSVQDRRPAPQRFQWVTGSTLRSLSTLESPQNPILLTLANAGMFSEAFQGIIMLSEFFSVAFSRGKLARFHFSPLFSFLILCEIILCKIPA